MKSLKLYWNWHYVKEGKTEPDSFNRWLIRGSIKIPCSDIEPYKWAGEGYANVALITMKATANANFVSHPSLPTFNVRVNNVLERSNLFNTGWGDTTQFYDSIEECQEFAQRVMDFHLDMLIRAEKEDSKDL